MSLTDCDIRTCDQLFGKFATATWMHDFYKYYPQTKVGEIVLPGTHDSATDSMTRKCSYAKFHKHRVSHELVYLWGKTQHHSVYSQLCDGIRYLDLRVEKNDNGWETFHGLTSNNLISVLNQIGKFAAEFPKEVIIVDFQHLVNFDFEEHVKLAEYLAFHPVLGGRLAGNHFDANSSFEDFWSQDKNVILFYNEGYEHFDHLFWHRVTINNPWPNSYQVDNVRQKLLAGITERNPHQFHVSQMVLTPDFYRIIQGIWSEVSCLFTMTIPSINTLLDNDFLAKLDSHARANKRRVNIIIVDFYEHTPLIEKCLEVNMKHLG